MMTPEDAERSGHYRDFLATVEPNEQGIRAELDHLYYDLHACHVGEMILVTESVQRSLDEMRRFILGGIAKNGCPAEWGVCPEHGDTLRSSARTTRCTRPGCDRSWNYDRLDLPCGEPIEYDVTNPDGTAGGGVCEGHAIGTRLQIPEATLTARCYDDQTEAE